MLNYLKLQQTVTKVLQQVRTGTIKLVRKAETVNTSAPWENDTVTTTEYTLDATAFAVDDEYIGKGGIEITDIKIVSAVPAIEPEKTTDYVLIDTVKYEIVNIIRIPKAGTAVAYLLFVRA